MKNKYTNEIKINVINEYQEGSDISTILKKYKIARSTFYDWLKLFKVSKKAHRPPITYSDYIKLNKELIWLKRQLEILEKTHCFKDSPRHQKLEAAEIIYGEYPTRVICRVLNLDHGTFLNHHYRRVKKTAYNQQNNMLRPEIKRIFEESGQRFGIQKYISN